MLCYLNDFSSPAICLTPSPPILTIIQDKIFEIANY